MPEVCGEPHPTLPDVFCEKPRPCYITHLNFSIQPPDHVDWEGNPEPSYESRRKEVDKLAGRIHPEPMTGPPTTMEGPGGARHTDPVTSHEAAIANLGRKTSARYRLLQAFAQERHRGLIDEEAAEIADLSLKSEYATRCSELRRFGYIQETGETKEGAAGVDRMCSQVTEVGLNTLLGRPSRPRPTVPPGETPSASVMLDWD